MSYNWLISDLWKMAVRIGDYFEWKMQIVPTYKYENTGQRGSLNMEGSAMQETLRSPPAFQSGFSSWKEKERRRRRRGRKAVGGYISTCLSDFYLVSFDSRYYALIFGRKRPVWPIQFTTMFSCCKRKRERRKCLTLWRGVAAVWPPFISITLVFVTFLRVSKGDPNFHL